MRGKQLLGALVSFDIDTYIKNSSKLEIEDLDFDDFRRQPLDEDTLRCLRYMHDVEFHTICYLRDMLVTRAHADPEVTTFLTFWAYEEHFHGDAIAEVLRVHDEMSGRQRVAISRKSSGWQDKVNPFINMVSSIFLKEFVAMHMTWGAINEWTTQAGYARLSALANHPTLTELLKRIMKQEGRHIDFYSTEAAKRLQRSAVARRTTRLALSKKWAPVGSGLMPRQEVRFLVSHLFGGHDGQEMAARIDRRIDRLPGLQGLGLISAAQGRYT